MDKQADTGIVKSLIINKIIADTYYALEEIFKPEELRGRGIINNQNSHEKLVQAYLKEQVDGVSNYIIDGNYPEAKEVIKDMLDRLKLNNIRIDEAKEMLYVHERDNFAKFSDAAAMKRK